MLAACPYSYTGLSWGLPAGGTATAATSSALWSSLVARDCGYAWIAWRNLHAFWPVSLETDWGFNKIHS